MIVAGDSFIAVPHFLATARDDENHTRDYCRFMSTEKSSAFVFFQTIMHTPPFSCLKEPSLAGRSHSYSAENC
jgi:hypothetical protein